MDAKNFTALTDRIKRELGLSYAAQAEAIGVTPAHISDCRAGRREASQTMIVALRAVAAGAPALREEGS